VTQDLRRALERLDAASAFASTPANGIVRSGAYPTLTQNPPQPELGPGSKIEIEIEDTTATSLLSLSRATFAESTDTAATLLKYTHNHGSSLPPQSPQNPTAPASAAAANSEDKDKDSFELDESECCFGLVNCDEPA